MDGSGVVCVLTGMDRWSQHWHGWSWGGCVLTWHGWSWRWVCVLTWHDGARWSKGSDRDGAGGLVHYMGGGGVVSKDLAWMELCGVCV